MLQLLEPSKGISVKSQVNTYRNDAISSAVLEIDVAAAELYIHRLLPKSYGVRSRVPWIEGMHNPKHRVDLGGQLWCNNVLRWLAFKVNLYSVTLF
jgi:hypothetical protein